MSLAKRSRNRQVAIKDEVIDGTYVFGSGYAAGDIIPDAFDIEIIPEWEQFTRTDMRGDLMRRPGIVTLKPGGINFKILLGGSAAAGTAPAQALAWKVCGLAEVVTASTDVDYRRNATDTVGRSIAVWMDGNRYGLAGCRADASIVYTDGEPCIMEVKARGVWAEQTAQAASVTPAAYTIVPPSFKNVALAIGAYTPVFESMTINLGHTVVIRKDANTATGFRAARISDAQPTITINPELDDIGTQDWFAKWDAKAIENLVAVIGSAGGNRLSITAQTTVQGKSFADRDGLDIEDLTLECNANASDVEGADLNFLWD